VKGKSKTGGKTKADKKSKKISDALAEASTSELAAMLSSLHEGNYDVIPDVDLSDFEAGYLAAELESYIEVRNACRPKSGPQQQS
jgi:hypothetical protein